MNTINITPIIDKIEKVVAKHKLAPGCYKRFMSDTMPNPYGCADAANILYTIGRFPRDAFERSEFVRILGDMQSADDGLFTEKPSEPGKFVHDPIHTTAHCMAAMELFDASPKYRATALEQYLAKDKMEEFFESFDWYATPGAPAHKGAGLYAALNLGGSDCREFNKNYFRWLWDNSDPQTGFIRRGCQNGQMSIWHHMGATFHFCLIWSTPTYLSDIPKKSLTPAWICTTTNLWKTLAKKPDLWKWTGFTASVVQVSIHPIALMMS